jgi:hypothetical protein
MSVFKYINLPVFIISLAFGIFAVYITVPSSRKILVYPTHENINSIQYRDKANNCFSIEEQEVKCPSNANKISKVPIQE